MGTPSTRQTRCIKMPRCRLNGIYEFGNQGGYHAQTPNILGLDYANFTISADFNIDTDAQGGRFL